MAALTCEICGGKLIGKPGGVFECDSCGMEYNTEWAKAKIQEIKGTVKVEGTVEVTGKVQIDGGTVKVEGGINIESLLKRGQMALEDRNWRGAELFFDDALNLDAECVQAYLGKLMAELRVSRQEDLENCAEPFNGRSNYQKVVRFADEDLRNTLQGYIAAINKRNEEARIARDKQKEEERIALEKEKERHEKERVATRERLSPLRNYISAGNGYSLCLYPDGSVKATERTGLANCGQSKVTGLTDIVAIGAGVDHSVGLKFDGTVVTTKYTGISHGRCLVGDWTNIVAVCAGYWHTVGLKADGTVVATGQRKDGQCDVDAWQDIVAISVGYRHTVGLKADGTVVATPYRGAPENNFGQCNVDNWTDIVAISACGLHTVGLKADGTVVATGWNKSGQCKVGYWRDIVAISAGNFHTVGLKMDGTVVVAGCEGERNYGQNKVSDWRNIVAISAGVSHTLGLKSDGTVVAVGNGVHGECEVSAWRLFNNLKDLEEERTAASEKRGRRAAGLCQHCGGELKGVLGKKCVSCGKPKDY